MLRPAQLADLSLTLVQHDFVVSTHQTIAAARLLAQLSTPLSRDDLALLLAPVFCSNARQQGAFPGIVADWARVALGPEAEARPAARTRAHARAGERLETSLLRDIRIDYLGAASQAGRLDEREEVGRRALRQALLACFRLRLRSLRRKHLLVLLALCLGGAGVATIQGTQTPGVPAPPPAHSADTHPGQDPAATAGGGEPGAAASQSGAADTREPGAMPAPLAPGGADMAALAAACTPLLAWLLLATRRRGFLERQPARRDHIALHLRSAPLPALGSWRQELAALGRMLRRRVSEPSPELDLAATLASYVKTGLPTRLFFGSRREPDYLALIDCLGSIDHYARIAEEVVGALHRDTGVNIEVFVYQADPRLLRHQPLQAGQAAPAPALDLDGLFGRFPQARLLVFSDGRELISQLSGRPAPWLDALLRWPHAVLVTPRPRKQWSVREHMLRKAGLEVVPLESASLGLLGEMLTAQHDMRVPAAGEATRTTPVYLRDVASLLDTLAPPPAQREELLQALRRDLGPRGFVWLSACAVYPEIQWGLTLMLGRALLPLDDERAGLLVSLAGLPWLRRGFMPDWLREGLLDALDAGDAATARAVVAAYLARVAKGPDALAADDGGDSDGDHVRIDQARRQGFWRDVADGLAAALRTARAPRVREDRVYLRFISGKPSRLAVSAGERIARLFHQNGSALGRAKTLPYLLLTTVLLGAALGQFAWRRHVAEEQARQDRAREAQARQAQAKPAPAKPEQPVPGAQRDSAPVAVGSQPDGEAATREAAAERARQRAIERAAAKDAGGSSPATPAPGGTTPATGQSVDTPQRTPQGTPAQEDAPALAGGTQARADEADRDAAALPYRAVFRATPTGRTTRLGPEQKFTFWLTPSPVSAASSGRFAGVTEVVYRMDHPTFTQKDYSSTNSRTGFRQTYTGWGCLKTVGITVRYKDGAADHATVDMCEALGQPAGVEFVPVPGTVPASPPPAPQAR